MGNFIDDYVEYNRNHGAPFEYHQWCACYLVGCALGRRAWMGNRGISPVFPNLYTVLVGPQGLLYKSTCISVAARIAAISGVTNRLPDSGTKQGILLRLKELQDPPPRLVTSPRDVLKGAEGAFFVRELSDMLGDPGKIDNEVLLWLQTWFDSRPDWEPWEYTTVARHEDPDILHQLNVSFLAGTTPRYVNDAFPHGCTEQGLGSRILWVVKFPEDARKGSPEWDEKEEDRLIRQLQEINQQVVGQFTLSTDAERYWKTWESLWTESVRLSESSSIGGFLARQQDYMKKLAMIRVASDPLRRQTLQIESSDLEWADSMLSGLIPGLKRLFQAHHSDTVTQAIMSIREDLRKSVIRVTTSSGEECSVHGLPMSDLRERYLAMIPQKYFYQAIQLMKSREFDWLRETAEYVKVEGHRRKKKVVFLTEEGLHG